MPIKGQSNLEFPIDREKCALWNVSVADVQDALQTAVGGKAFTEMIEGERTFDITLRWPEGLRKNEDLILDIPVDVLNNRVIASSGKGGPGSGDLGLRGTSVPLPAFTGSSFNTTFNNPASVPRRRLRDLVVPLDEHGVPDPRRPVRALRRFDHRPRAGQAADRRQVQRARPRPGQRRGRGPESHRGSASRRRTTPSGAASSRK